MLLVGKKVSQSKILGWYPYQQQQEANTMSAGVSAPPLDESIRQEVNHALTNRRMNHFLEKVNHAQTYSMNYMWTMPHCWLFPLTALGLDVSL